MQANVHHYDGSTNDEHGEPKHGYFFEFLDPTGNPITAQVGPYPTKLEVETECQAAYERMIQ